jgi:nucleotide sugar dehydrogenase
MKKIGVIGVGKLGLSFALLAEHRGFEVWGSDISESYTKQLNEKSLKSNEPYVEEYLKGSKNFHATTSNVEVINNCDIIFTFVPTPSLPTGEYNHQYVEEVIDTFDAMHYTGNDLMGKIFVVGCTTNPGYVDTITQRLSEYGMDVCYNPEFIAQGDIVNGLKYADMVLIGTSSMVEVERVKDIYRQLMDDEPKFNVMSNTAAEITKISVNCYLTTKISFANMIGEICHNTGISDEVNTVLSAIGDDSRVGKKYLNYGFGFGGPCLPRDNRALGVHAEKVGLEINLPLEIDKFNIEHHKYLVNKFVSENPDRETTFVFNTVTYKKGTDQLTESQQLHLLLSLLAEGYNCVVIDIDEVIEKLEKPLTSTYGDKIKFQPIGTIAEGVKIIL